MSFEWVRVKVEDACELIVDCVNKTAPTVDYRTPYRMIRASHVKNGRICLTDEKFVNKETYEKWIRRAKLEVGDVLLTREAPLGSVGMIREEDTLFLGQRIVQCRANREVLDPGFLLYSFLAPDLQTQFHSYGGTGSTVDHIRVPDCVRFEISLPPLNEQKAIAHILGTLDDKIELNRKTNETLEAMAKAIFKSWFVDFDPVRAKAEGRPTGLPAEISDLFPDSFEDSELGEIPSGWQCCPFTQLVDVISGGTPKTSVDEYWNGSIPWFSVVDAPSGADCWVIQTDKSITHLGLDNCSSKLLPIGTTIISARGTVGKVCLTGQDMAMNQSCYGLRSKAANCEYFCFYLTKSLVEILEARAHGSVFSTITRDTLDGVSTISPPLEVIQSFNGIAGALLFKIKNNLEENRILGNQRDALLPKLISGEIRIPDAEKMLEEVGI